MHVAIGLSVPMHYQLSFLVSRLSTCKNLYSLLVLSVRSTFYMPISAQLFSSVLCLSLLHFSIQSTVYAPHLRFSAGAHHSHKRHATCLLPRRRALMCIAALALPVPQLVLEHCLVRTHMHLTVAVTVAAATRFRAVCPCRELRDFNKLGELAVCHVLGHSLPPWLSRRVTVRVRFISVPWPLTGAHAPHDVYSQSTGHSCFWHSLSSMNAPHALPPSLGAALRMRKRRCVPPPHVLLHCVHTDHVDILQSCGQLFTTWQLRTSTICVSCECVRQATLFEPSNILLVDGRHPHAATLLLARAARLEHRVHAPQFVVVHGTAWHRPLLHCVDCARCPTHFLPPYCAGVFISRVRLYQ